MHQNNAPHTDGYEKRSPTEPINNNKIDYNKESKKSSDFFPRPNIQANRT